MGTSALEKAAAGKVSGGLRSHADVSYSTWEQHVRSLLLKLLAAVGVPMRVSYERTLQEGWLDMCLPTGGSYVNASMWLNVAPVLYSIAP